MGWWYDEWVHKSGLSIASSQAIKKCCEGGGSGRGGVGVIKIDQTKTHLVRKYFICYKTFLNCYFQRLFIHCW